MDLDIEEYVEFSINDEMSDSDYLLKMHVSSSESDSSESNFSLNEDQGQRELNQILKSITISDTD